MSANDTVILVTNKGMGKGPEDLQLTLIGKYLQLLDQNGELPTRFVSTQRGSNR